MMPAKTPKIYSLVSMKELGLDKASVSTENLFVYMETSSEFVIFLAKGEEITSKRRENLKSLEGKNLYVESNAVGRHFNLDVGSGQAFKGEVLGAEANEKLQLAYRGFVNPSESPVLSTQVIGQAAEETLNVLAPEVGNLKVALLGNLLNLHLMNDAATITALAFLVGLSNDFNSRTNLKNLALAAHIMDCSLVELTQEQLESYYKSRKELPEHILEKIKLHPVRSEQLLQRTSYSNDIIAQMVLTHHELHNGRGYHRGIKTSNVSGLCRVLALAVDWFEYLKAAELQGRPVPMYEMLLKFQEKGMEPHDRRHSQLLVTNVIKFLNPKAAG